MVSTWRPPQKRISYLAVYDFARCASADGIARVLAGQGEYDLDGPRSAHERIRQSRRAFLAGPEARSVRALLLSVLIPDDDSVQPFAPADFRAQGGAR
jgi:hypothetical protein